MSEKPFKLTRSQEVVLRELAVRSSSYSPSYPPVAKLLSYGLIKERPSKYSYSYELTDAGRALAASPAQTEER